MEHSISTTSNDHKLVMNEDYHSNIVEHFASVPEIAMPLLDKANGALVKIKEMIYSSPSMINVIKSSMPKEAFQVVLTNKQKSKIAKGALELMTKKDGTLLAKLINPKTKKIVSTVSLKKIKITPEISQAMSSFAMQMQMIQIAEDIQHIQIAVEEIRQGQEYDRLATAYSCQQKLLQAMNIKNPEFKAIALLRVASDAEDSRNLLMLSQKANLNFIKKQPESFWRKLISGADQDKINLRMNEIRDSLYVVNMVSLSEAIAYVELGEMDAAQMSLQYYAKHIQKTYLTSKGLVQRLDMIDPSPNNYWSMTLPNIEKKIQELTFNEESLVVGN